MAIGDQTQQVTSQGLGLDQIADVVNRQKISDKRLRNEMMRQGTSDPNAFSIQNKQQLQQAQQPSEFWGAGRKLAENQNIQDEGYGVLNSVSPVLGGQRYYYGNVDPTSKEGLSGLYDNPQYKVYKQQQDLLNAPPAKNYSITELQDLISPPKPYNPFGSGGDETYKMPEIAEMERQRGLMYELMGQNPSAIDPAKLIGTNTDYAGLNAQALYKKPLDDIFNAKVFGAYHPLAHQNDPTVKFLNSKYELTPGGWDLGDGMRYVPTKSYQGNDWYGVRGKTGNEEMDAPTFSQFIEKDWADAFTPEGTFNKEGWHTIKPDYDAIARKGIINTLSVISPALFYGLGLVGSGGEAAAAGGSEAAGASASIPAGSEGLMTGSLATEAAPAVAGSGSSAGMFGNSNLNLGNTYLNAAGEGVLRNAITSGGDPKSMATGALGGAFGAMAGNNSSIVQAAQQAGISPSTLQALFSGASNTLGGLAAGQGGKQALQSGLGAGLGAYAGSTIQGLAKNSLGDMISKMAGGAASGGINSLFTRNSPMEGSLYGALSGGLHGFLNSTAKDANTLTPETNKQNQQNAQGLAKLIRQLNKRNT